jgi:hypothetical protein
MSDTEMLRHPQSIVRGVGVSLAQEDKMPATVRVKTLRDAGAENEIRVQLEEALREYDDCRVTVSEGAASDVWEIKVDVGGGREHSVKRLQARQTVGKIVEEAVHMVKIARQQEIAS